MTDARSRPLLAPFACALVLAACGGGGATPALDGGALDGGALDGGAALDGGGASDAGTPPDAGALDRGAPSSTYPAFEIDWPQLVGSAEGVVASPRLVAVTFDGDPLREDIERFVANIGNTAYWRTTVSEYGVGTATAGTPVHLAGPAPAALSDTDIQTFLLQRLDGTHAEWPAADDRTIYLLFYPRTTTVTAGSLRSCFNFGAYHSAVRAGPRIAPYAVMPRCPATATVPALSTELGVLTGVTSHEILEAVTDVFPYELDGYRLPDTEHIAFATFAGAENGDMCQFSDAAWIVDPELGATVQRSWSNVAAAAGREPCVPAAPGPYFVGVPQMTEDVRITFEGVELTTPGINLRMGESKTVQVLLVSNGDTGGPFTLTGRDRQDFFGRGRALTFRFERNQGVNGEKVYVTITRTGSDPNFGGAIPFALIAQKGDVRNYWFSVVGSP